MNKVTVPNNQQEIKENRPLSIYSFDPEAQAERDYEENLLHEMEDADDPDEQEPVAKSSAFEPQTVSRFMKRKFPPKEPLIEGVLYRRDQISLTGRRRHGKTTLLANIALAGAQGKDYLGLSIPRPFTTVAFFLEDDPGELQDKLKKMIGNDTVALSRFHVYDRNEFVGRKIPIDMSNKDFKKFVLDRCECASCKPDLVIFDNLGMLIGADYNNAPRIHGMTEVTYFLTQKLNAAVLIAAHPRKGAGTVLDAMGDKEKVTLKTNPEEFFEATMGSSHFINSTGSLWGIERDKDDRTTLLLGSQRVTGRQTVTMVEQNEHGWFERLNDLTVVFDAVVNTPKRIKAWSLLPKSPATFSSMEGEKLVKPALSASNYYAWLKELRRAGLLEEVQPGRFMRKQFGSDAQKQAASPKTAKKQE